jgi:hypothetical protein
MLRALPRSTAWLFSLLVGLSSLLTPATSVPAQAALTDTPVPIVSDLVEEWAVGAGLLYWANNCYAEEFQPIALLKRKPASGGTERTLESINDTALCITYQDLLSSNDGLYYFDDSQDRIERMPLGKPYTPRVVKTLTDAQVPSVGKPFVEADGYLYWLHFFNKIFRVRKDGSGEIETVVDTATSPTDFLIVGNRIYWADSAGIWSQSIDCATLPCADTRVQYTTFGTNTSGYGLVYQLIGGRFGAFRIYWVQRFSSGANNDYSIRYRDCNQLIVCFLLPPEGQLPDPPPTFYAGTTNWRIGNPLLANNNLYWTEADFSSVNNNNGDVKRKASSTANTPGADTIATGQTNSLDDQLFVANDQLFFARRGNGVYTLPLNASAIVRDFSVDGMEVTQGIQNLANSAPLITDKTTYVRVYGRQLAGPSAPNVEVRLVGIKNDLPLPGSPLRPINGIRALTTGGSFDRARLTDSWYFLLPASWIAAGNIFLSAEVDPRQLHTDPDRINNIISQNLAFQNQPPVCVDGAGGDAHAATLDL